MIPLLWTIILILYQTSHICIEVTNEYEQKDCYWLNEIQESYKLVQIFDYEQGWFKWNQNIISIWIICTWFLNEDQK